MPPKKEPKPSVSSLDFHIGYQLRMVSNAASHAFARKLATSHVTVAEWVVLREMYEAKEKTSPSFIAQVTGLTRGAVSKLIDRLLAKKFVTRFESIRDRRYQDIALTKTAVDLVPKLSNVADEQDATFFSVLTKAEQESLKAMLLKLAKHHNLNTHPIE